MSNTQTIGVIGAGTIQTGWRRCDVLNGITVRGSIVGMRLDLQEALDFAGQGKVKATVASERLETINDVFTRMCAGDIQGRIGIDFDK